MKSAFCVRNIAFRAVQQFILPWKYIFIYMRPPPQAFPTYVSCTPASCSMTTFIWGDTHLSLW